MFTLCKKFRHPCAEYLSCTQCPLKSVWTQCSCAITSYPLSHLRQFWSVRASLFSLTRIGWARLITGFYWMSILSYGPLSQRSFLIVSCWLSTESDASPIYFSRLIFDPVLSTSHFLVFPFAIPPLPSLFLVLVGIGLLVFMVCIGFKYVLRCPLSKPFGPYPQLVKIGMCSIDVSGITPIYNSWRSASLNPLNKMKYMQCLKTLAGKVHLFQHWKNAVIVELVW